jgi:hypothetical protein
LKVSFERFVSFARSQETVFLETVGLKRLSIHPTLTIRANHVEVIEYLLKKGAKLEARDRQSNTALIFAAYDGHAEAAQVQKTIGSLCV